MLIFESRLEIQINKNFDLYFYFIFQIFQGKIKIQNEKPKLGFYVFYKEMISVYRRFLIKVKGIYIKNLVFLGSKEKRF